MEEEKISMVLYWAEIS